MSRIGTLVALCKEGRIATARQPWWYRHASAPGAFGGDKVSALPIAEHLPLKPQCGSPGSRRRAAPAKLLSDLSARDVLRHADAQSLWVMALSIDQRGLALREADLGDVDNNTTTRSPLG